MTSKKNFVSLNLYWKVISGAISNNGKWEIFHVDEQSPLDIERAINRDIQVNESSMNLAAAFNTKVPGYWSIHFNPCYFGKI